jgi:uncharacterized membrane protein YhaH (DUF805 family)
MDLETAIRTCFARYATFTGRARRSEYWFFLLFIVLGNLAATAVDAVLRTGGVVGGLFALATFVPQLAVTTRRLHDTGRSGWWQVSYLLPGVVLGIGTAAEQPVTAMVAGLATLVLFVIVLVWLIRRGDAGPNRFGPDPTLGVTPMPYG